MNLYSESVVLSKTKAEADRALQNVRSKVQYELEISRLFFILYTGQYGDSTCAYY